jgi:hypothetical protein
MHDGGITDADAATADAGADAVVDAGPPVRVSGHVDYGGPVSAATVTVLSPSSQSTITDSNGDFFFYFPAGTKIVVKVSAPNLFPMIRGMVAGSTMRIRNFYLAGPPEIEAAQSLGRTFDPTKAIVEVDFRNASVGAYSVSLVSASGALIPGFGMAFDEHGDPQLSTSTLTGGDGSTLLLADLAPSTVSFVPSAPADAGAPQPCDAQELPLEANTVTWFDFETGSASCE